MTHVQQTLIVADWEFRRLFKWKSQLLGLAFFMVVSVASTGAGLVAGAKGDTVVVALSGVEMPAGDARFRFVPAAPTESARVNSLQSGEIQGVLSRHPDGRFELLVAKDPRYRAELVALVAGMVRRERLALSGIVPDELTRILAPPSVDVRFTDPFRERRGRPEKVAAGVCIFVMIMAIFMSLAHLMTGITGEKQLRVTESVVSAISPQAWIDGKVLGIAGYSLVLVFNTLVGMLMVALAGYLATGFALPSAAMRPEVLLALLAYTVLGLLLWNSFFAAVASTIEDPNSSSRASAMFLPLLPVVMSYAVIRDPDALVARILAMCPLTSAPALPMRMVLSDPTLLEIGTSLALLVGSIWLMRRMAGRIFEIGMLMYGKEPSLQEMARWASEGRHVNSARRSQ